MSEIEFKGIAQDEIKGLREAFDYIAKSKTDGSFNEATLSKIIGSKINSHFINPTKEEADEILKQWKLNPNIELSWDFGSWFDALNSAEILYQSIEINKDGAGKLIFEQLAWPSGGIDATAELIKAFGGEVIANNAI